MKNYIENCKKNLLEHSIEKDDYEIALDEWYFLDEVIDNNEFLEINTSRPSCELCEREDLRWQFVIFNKKNNNQLKVGSSCIKQFNVALLDKSGNKIYGKERNSKINKLITIQRINSSNKMTFSALNELCKVNKDIEQNSLFIDCWTQLKVNGAIEPKIALFLINNFNWNGIDISKIDMKIDLQKRKCIEQLNNMSKNAYISIRLYINDKKRKHYDKYFGI
ncbi:MAG: hypothetical protein LBV17_06820 [Treponema sp.]|jgi:hypothetical protein|nr:hypothetical protein [Treponema sp.]